ncbi:MAG: dockerin type I domain-containing protein [Clostridia bacterium]|nr:dockerin type I domain-containing protein [Clostridia bacterium]
MKKRNNWRIVAGLCVLTMLCSFFSVGFTGVQAAGAEGLKESTAVRQIAEWKTGQAYAVGDLVSFNGSIYKCTIPHTGQVGWEPGIAQSLWEKQSGNTTPVATNTPTPTNSPTPNTTGLKIVGFILPDFVYDSSVGSIVKSGFKVEITEKGIAAQTDAKGYFELQGLSQSTSAVTLKISKDNYLQRTIKNVIISGNLQIGSESQPVPMWAGDMLIGGTQDKAINMSDIVELINYFNTSKGDGKYNEGADLNKDNAVNMSDILIVIQHFNTSEGDYPLVTPVVISTPIPATNTPTPTTTTTVTATPTPSTTPGNDNELKVGQSRVLTDAQIQSLWSGIDPKFSPDNAAASVQQALSKTQYEELFPMRIGSSEWHSFAKGQSYYKANQTDYYSYDNFIAAVRDVANIKYKIVYRQGSRWLQRLYRLDKAQKKETMLFETQGFNDDWVMNRPLEIFVYDFGAFLKEGVEKDRKRELAGFLANIAHETGGGWATAPGGMLRWGLYWNEEVSYINSSSVGYVDGANKDYPAVSGKSYHGRGPIQLSWNYNYGLFSSIIFGDKNILLQEPERVTQDGKLGFMTAMLFWMTPQSPKPSCHDIMVGNWIPTAEEKAKGLTPCFGATIMVINGGLEGNLSESDYRVGRRAGHYRDITGKMGVDIAGEKVDTLGMQQF